MKKPSELRSEKRSCYQRDTHHLNLVADLHVFLNLLVVYGFFFHNLEGSKDSIVLTSGSVTCFEKVCIWGMEILHPLCPDDYTFLEAANKILYIQ